VYSGSSNLNHVYDVIQKCSGARTGSRCWPNIMQISTSLSKSWRLCFLSHLM